MSNLLGTSRSTVVALIHRKIKNLQNRPIRSIELPQPKSLMEISWTRAREVLRLPCSMAIMIDRERRRWLPGGAAAHRDAHCREEPALVDRFVNVAGKTCRLRGQMICAARERCYGDDWRMRVTLETV